jgi:hypothetical protein
MLLGTAARGIADAVKTSPTRIDHQEYPCTGLIGGLQGIAAICQLIVQDTGKVAPVTLGGEGLEVDHDAAPLLLEKRMGE